MAPFGIPPGETLKASSQTSAADLVLLLRRQQDLLDLVSNSAGIDQIVKRLVEFADESFRPARCAIFELDPDLGLVRRFSADHVTDDVSGSALDSLKAILKEAKPSLVPETDIGIATALVEHFGRREGRAFAEPISDGGDAIRRVLAVYDPQSCVGQETVQAFAGYVGCAIGAANKACGDTDRFERLTAAIPGVIYQRRVTADGDIRYTYISKGARELFGYSPEEIISNPGSLFGTFGPEYRARFHERLLAASRALSTWDVEATIITPDGKKKYTHAMARPSREADGSVLWTGLILDETQLRGALLDSLSQGFVMYDTEDRLVIRNTHYIDLFPALGETAVPGASYQDVVRAELGAAAGGSEPLHSEFVRRTAIHTEKRGSYEHQVNADTWVLVTEHASSEGGTVVLYTDVSELKRRDNQIRYLAFHDPMTALANRTLFNQRLEEALVEAKARGTRVAVLCVDLEKFKEVNDRCGGSGRR